MKSCKVCITTKSTLASLLFKGLATKHRTVKWSIWRLSQWLFDCWVYSRLRKRCAFRRLMHFPREEKLQLRKRAEEKFSQKKVTRIEQDVNVWGNTCGFQMIHEGLQTRTLCRTTAKCCTDYANLNFDLCVAKYVNQNHSVMHDSIFWRNNCSDRKSSRGYCDECREIVSKPDVEIDDFCNLKILTCCV